MTLAKEEDVILAFGSLSFIGELTKAVQDEKTGIERKQYDRFAGMQTADR